MAADVINVEFGALDSAAQSLQTKAAALNAAMEQLQASLAPIKETWYASGSTAGAAANESETRLRAAIGDVVGVITRFSTKVSNASVLQQDLERKNAELFA
ncbi:uncharacterized protein YukE [Catenuloplanes nepalensis]|uniref:Uncharacterized protein YukE n=1 Tax=Catenuloplanes nepalensis TaxID=587533 RepID=A0ABT9MRK7_9ACTN|nr:WXG100 family type VII secretion target [Catenuloplanes nepalensis]MDP9794065.1 uncharacterized protein YukE [Catenuloplanes nepalensis]